MSTRSEFLVGVDFPGTGAHPSSWRRDDSRAEELFTADYWIDLVGAADAAGVDLAFLPDRFGVTDARGTVPGRLEAVGLAARLSTATSRIGLVPTATVTHTEPFHLAKAVQTLDHTTRGRAGWQVAVSAGKEQAELFGRKDVQSPESLWSEAADAAEVARRLWDSWEDDAEIRDVATGRFVDRDKLHYIDFVGEHFSVKGPSITPRSPQGRPPIVVAAADEPSIEFAIAHADVVRISVPDVGRAAELAARIRGATERAITVLLDVEVLLAEDDADAALAQLDGWSGSALPAASVRFVGRPGALVDALGAVHGVDGVVIRPLALASTLPLLARVVPELRSAAPAGATVRERLGLGRPANPYTSVN